MKKNWTARIAALVLIMTLVTASLVAGTYAKYTTTVSGIDSVTVAKWVAKFDETDTFADAFTFDLFDTFSDTGVDGALLAPGTSGSFTVYYDTKDSQVARNVTITLNAANLSTLSLLTFAVDNGEDPDTDITAAAKAGTLGNVVNLTLGPADDATGSVTINWEWPFNSSDANDILDTEDGETPVTGDVTVTFVAKQLDIAAAAEESD